MGEEGEGEEWGEGEERGADEEEEVGEVRGGGGLGFQCFGVARDVEELEDEVDAEGTEVDEC